MNILDAIQQGLNLLMGWPLIIYVLSIAVACTVLLRGIQFTHFFSSWKSILFPEKTKEGDMSPLQAFVNTLSTNLGNGSIGGMAVAMAIGGPGAAFWVLVIGLILMSVRFAEVYISTWYGERAPKGSTLGGPMLYLREVPGRSFLPYFYSLACLLFGLTLGNGAQANTMTLSLMTTWPSIPLWSIVVVLVALVFYIVIGGAQRIAAASDAIVPVKVVVFFVSTFTLLAYHYQNIIPALQLIFKSAFSPLSIAGGALGFTVQQAMKTGMNNSVFATESGLGTAAILFGFTGSQHPIKSGYLGMVSTFVSTLVCFLICLAIVASGVWDSGLTSTALTIAAFNTVFGMYGGWIVTFLSVSFGIGCLISYGYISRAVYLYVTQNKFAWFFPFVYAGFSGFAAIMKVDLLWKIAEYFNALLLIVNLFAIIYLLPKLTKEINQTLKAHKE